VSSVISFSDMVCLWWHYDVPWRRESDYAILTRDFESYVDDQVLTAVKNASLS